MSDKHTRRDIQDTIDRLTAEALRVGHVIKSAREAGEKADPDQTAIRCRDHYPILVVTTAEDLVRKGDSYRALVALAVMSIVREGLSGEQ